MRCLQALSCRPSLPEAARKHLLDLWRIFWQRSDRTPFSPTQKATPSYYLFKIFSAVHIFSLSCISALTPVSVLFRGPAARHLFHWQFTAEQPWRQTVLLTLRGPACSDMLLNIVSFWTSVKGLFWDVWCLMGDYFKSDMKCNSSSGTGGKSSQKAQIQMTISRSFQKNSVFRPVCKLFHCHFNSMSGKDCGRRDLQWSLGPFVMPFVHS